MIRFREKRYSQNDLAMIKYITDKLDKDRIYDFDISKSIPRDELSINTDLDNLEIYIPLDDEYMQYDIEKFISKMIPFPRIDGNVERNIFVQKIHSKLTKDQYYKLVKYLINETGFIVIYNPFYNE